MRFGGGLQMNLRSERYSQIKAGVGVPSLAAVSTSSPNIFILLTALY